MKRLLSSRLCSSSPFCTASVLTARRGFSTLVPKYNFIASPRTVSILGVPLSHGQPKYGVERGPQAIRNNNLAAKLENDGWRVDDLGDLQFETIDGTDEEAKSNAKFAKMVGTANKILAEAVYKETKKGKFVVNLGGDYSLGIGSVAGILKARPETGVIWVDAHADVNTPKTSLSGNIHGMSTAFLMALHGTKRVPGFEWLQSIPDLAPHRLAYIGLRDLDPAEKELIKQLGIKAFTMQDVDRHGIGRVMERAIQHVCCRVDRPLHLSIDIDSVDPAYAPSTGTRVRGGLTYREAYFIAESLAETGLLTSMDMVEVNPSISVSSDDAKATVDMAVGLVCSALGNRIL